MRQENGSKPCLYEDILINSKRREFIDRGEWCLKVERKIMKKFFSLFMMLALSLTLSACSSEPKVEEEKEVVYSSYVRGVWTDNVYTNNYLGFSFTLPENWVIASDEELMTMLDTASEDLSEDMKKKYDLAIEKAVSFFDFAIFNVSTGETVMLHVEDLTKNALGVLYTEDNYIDIVERDFKDSVDLEIEVYERSNVSFAFGKFRSMKINIENLMTQEYLVTKDGKYMISFMLSYLDQYHEGVDSILEQFQ